MHVDLLDQVVQLLELSCYFGDLKQPEHLAHSVEPRHFGEPQQQWRLSLEDKVCECEWERRHQVGPKVAGQVVAGNQFEAGYFLRSDRVLIVGHKCETHVHNKEHVAQDVEGQADFLLQECDSVRAKDGCVCDEKQQDEVPRTLKLAVTRNQIPNGRSATPFGAEQMFGRAFVYDLN
jgi:hypothetical protein